MPELPEVEVVRRGLAPRAGRIVRRVDVLDERAVTRHRDGGADFAARLTGRSLGVPDRRGKFLWVPLGAVAAREVDAIGRDPGLGAAIRVQSDANGGETRREEAMLVHLGMSGQVLLDRGRLQHRHERVRIGLDDGTEVVFADQRTFGSLALDRLIDGVPSQVAHIARDPLDAAFPDREFIRRLRGRRTEIKRALLDQTLVSGIGNIYADEALWIARVHPAQPTATISAAAARRVLDGVRDVMHRALAEGGTSFDALYVHVNGASGYFARSLRAYGQHGRPCPRCGHALVRESFMQRGSHFCPHCQRVRTVVSSAGNATQRAAVESIAGEDPNAGRRLNA